MRFSTLFCLVPVALCVAASPSSANVTISNAATTNMTCSGGVCAPTAADAVLNVQDLENMLASGNATVTTTGAGVQAGNIHVNARLTWSAATTLTLDAYRSIDVNAKVVVAGTGGVSLTTNDGGSTGDFACNDPGRIQFSNLSSALTINGTPYMLVNSVASLASAVAANPSVAVALAKNYNAKKDGTYTASPILTDFFGSFNGLGNEISNLSIKHARPGAYNVGLFAVIDYTSTIANIRLINEIVQGGAYSSVGGLVGFEKGMIAHSFNTGTISGVGDVGGLVGLLGEGVISDSGSTATVSGGTAGGLVGDESFQGEIVDSWATGNVAGGGAGGLVGWVDSLAYIRHSWASGQVEGTIIAGGLVGEDDEGVIERSHATGAVTCQAVGAACGGLLGWAGNSGLAISQSYATGAVTGLSNETVAGGLLGNGDVCGQCVVANCYATGAVSGWIAGGLEGFWGGTNDPRANSHSYATGAVNGTNLAGGLIGTDNPYGFDKDDYWDVTTSGITNKSQGAGNVANDPGIKGLSDRKLKSGVPKGFDPKIWAEDSSINGGLPYLINNPPAN